MNFNKVINKYFNIKLLFVIVDMSVCKPIVKFVVFLILLITKCAQPFKKIHIYIYFNVKFWAYTMGTGLLLVGNYLFIFVLLGALGLGLVYILSLNLFLFTFLTFFFLRIPNIFNTHTGRREKVLKNLTVVYI